MGGASLAPAGSVGYVVCPDAVTPVELATHTAEAPIPLPISGTPEQGDFAIATSPDGRWAYVVTADGSGARSQQPAADAIGAHHVGGARDHLPPASSTGGSPQPPTRIGAQNVVIPIDLVTQQAGRPIDIPGQGGTHAIVVLPGGRTVLAASGSTVVPVDVATRRLGTPIDLGAGTDRLRDGPRPGRAPPSTSWCAGGIIPVDTASATAGATIPTGLPVVRRSTPHGIAVTDDGSTIYVVGQGPPDYGGRVLPIATADGTVGGPASFDNYGISDPAALAVEPDGSALSVVDSANNWVNPAARGHVRRPPDAGPAARPGTGRSHDRVPSTPPTSSSGPGAPAPSSSRGSTPSFPTTRLRDLRPRHPGVHGRLSMAVAPLP